MTWSKFRSRLRIVVAIVLFASVASLLVREHPQPQALATPSSLLAEADRLAWLQNWDRAAGLYARAEQIFGASGDRKKELHARIGRLRSETETTSLADTVQELGSLLEDPAVNSDPRLRLYCLTARAYAEFDYDIGASKRDWQQALALADTLGDGKWVSRARGELGVMAFVDGDLPTAAKLVGKALISAYQTHDVAAQIDFFSLVGTGFNEQLRYTEALAFFDQAIKVAEKNQDAGFPYLAYQGQVSAFLGLNRQTEAQKTLATVLATAQAQKRKDQEALALILFGDLAIASKDTQNARTYYERAGQIFQEFRIYRGLDEAMFKLASIYRDQGQLDLASRSVFIGLEAVRRAGGGYYLPRALSALAELEVSQTRYREADHQFQEAERRLKWVLTALHSEKEIAAVAGAMSDTYIQHFRLLAQQRDVAGAFRVLERIRGLTAASLFHPQGKTAKESALVPALNTAIDKVQLELLRREKPSQQPSLLDELDLYENELAFVTNESHPKKKRAFGASATLPFVQARLGRNEILLEYVLDEPRSFCIVITRDSARLASIPAGRARIAELAGAYLAELRSLRSADQLASELYSVLLEPIPEISRKPHVIISPDGILHLLPYEALRSRDGGFLVQSKLVSYTPSGTILWRLRRMSRSRAQRPLLAVGAVDYAYVRHVPFADSRRTLSAGITSVSTTELEDLPTSREEVLSVARTAANDAEVLLGENATETAFKSRQLQDFRVLHLAVHAVADPEHPDRAALMLGVDPHTSDDGLLQVREIVGLPLDADLVTLSACETGVGRMEGEAGILSLERGFLVAGARAVVASLWDVEDHSTTVLMKSFYSHLSEGEGKAAALAHAKRDLLTRYPDIPPYYWAGFVLVGEGSRPVVF